MAMVSCRSAARRDCYVRSEWNCVDTLAGMALEKNPNCCQCLRDRGMAEAKRAVDKIENRPPTNVVVQLMDAKDLLDRAVSCSRNRHFVSERDDVNQLYRSIVDDTYAPLWNGITQIEDPDQRVRAVLDHKRYYYNRCTHEPDAQIELHRYITSVRMQRSLLEVRQALLDLSDQPEIADQLLAVYMKRRLDGAADELQAMQALRIDLNGTPYEATVDRKVEARLNESLYATSEATVAEKLCPHFPSVEGRETCRTQVEGLWSRQIDSAATVEELLGICDRAPIDSRRRCHSKLAKAAFKAAKDNPTADNLELAKVLSSRDPETKNEYRRFVFRRSADDSFAAVQLGISERGMYVPPSIQTWREFQKTFDAMVVELFPGEPSLRAVHGGLATRVDGEIAKLQTSVKINLRRTSSHCSQYLADETEEKPKLNQIDNCIKSVVQVLQSDHENEEALTLLRELEEKRFDLEKAPAPYEWSDVFIPLALSEAIRAIVPQSLARLAARLVTYGLRSH